jgi:hypothetical protein
MGNGGKTATEADMATLPSDADGGAALDDAEVEDGGSWADMFVNMYYALVNICIMLGSISLLLVAYWQVPHGPNCSN